MLFHSEHIQNKLVLMTDIKVVNIQKHWVCGLCLSSGIPNTRKHNVSETGSVSGEGRKTLTLLGPLEELTSLEDGNRSSFPKRCIF
jgi:hypothetical protein